MKIDIFIHPHERHEAIEAYADWLTPRHVQAIKEAEDDAIITFTWDVTLKKGEMIIESWPEV